MNTRKTLVALGLLLGGAILNAHASLTSYTGADGAGLVYSSVGNVTWTQDANLFKTLSNADHSLISRVIALTPTTNYYASSGPQVTLTASDFGSFNVNIPSSGFLSWWGAIAFANYLNSIDYGGSHQWRLPTSNAIVGFNGTAGNELGQLFYSELNGTAGKFIPNTPTFDNESPVAYWSGIEFTSNQAAAWGFDARNGAQGYDEKGRGHLVWLVSPGQVAAVPIPGALALFGTGLMGLLGLRRK
ncbi:DUF1566 domain-containing protein [Methylomonas sp. CM2]|uniref:Lcl C-terminal domain-containing protein n=1 Tax=Methylomonas sp. CM2 TaxID=3417647 RepID=UPI003CF141E2